MRGRECTACQLPEPPWLHLGLLTVASPGPQPFRRGVQGQTCFAGLIPPARDRGLLCDLFKRPRQPTTIQFPDDEQMDSSELPTNSS
jgi:hypothetical protein